ncbi:hypothetical protein [Helicobacter mesocricetorum]|uniref:hypothetical protein n=1 Tax=Helicobacter mesocricetorum TaxID=87012 RepID=UPI000CF03146|nr:hypothetical protein [Helicobacter mesocricetorum]
MLKYFVYLSVLWFVGCATSPVNFMKLTPTSLEESYIQATRKTEIIYQEKTQIILIATHLSEFDEETYPKQKGEVFFISVYQSERERGFLKEYNLVLNDGEKPLKVTPLKASELKGLMAEYAIPWGEHYLLEFSPQNKRIQDRLSITISHKKFGENTLNFGFKAIQK